MPSSLIDALVSTDALADAFSDRSFLQAMFRFESALARAEADLGVIPNAAADAIARAAIVDDGLELDGLAREARTNATLSIPVIRLLTARVAALDPEAAHYVHWGATSQDVFDTALVLCVRTAWSSIARDHIRLTTALTQLAQDHEGTVMLGRTLLQPALPSTFGLKVAGWLGGVARCWKSWTVAYEQLLVLQFGGAAGTLAAIGKDGPAVESALARELDLTVPDAPWHAHRDRIAAFVAAAGIYAGSLAKIARDVSLLMQHEVGEACERGGESSTMPHKRNPAGCAIVLAAAHRLSGIVGGVIGSLSHEHERAVGGWHAEGSAVADAMQASGSATAALADVFEGLSVSPERMRENLDKVGGTIFAEQLSLMLAPVVGRARAADMARRATTEAVNSARPLADVVASMPELAAHLSAENIGRLADPAAYLGSADIFRRRLLAEAAAAVRPR